MATPIVKIASLQIDTNEILKESARLSNNLEVLRSKNKELAASGQKSSEAFQQNAARIKNLSKEYNDNQKLAASLIAVSKDTAKTMETEGKSVQQLRNDRAKLQQIGKNITGDTKEEIEARNKLNKAIDEQTQIIKSDASPAYVQQADNVGNYLKQQTALGGVLQTGNDILNVGKGIYMGYAASIKAAASQIFNAKAGTEGMNAAQKAGAVATNILSGAMKLLKVAIAATGIGLLVVALGALVSYFSKTQAGADKLSKVMAAVGAIVDVLIDRVSQFGGALVKFLSGDFAGGFDDMKASLEGVGDELQREARLAYELEAAFQAMEDREISLIKTQAQRKKNVEELRLLAKDEQKDLRERAALLAEAGELEKDQLADELALAQERARISRERLALGESTRDQIREDAELQARVIELETESLKKRRSIEAEKQGLLKRARAEEQSAAAAREKERENELKEVAEKSALEFDIYKAQNEKRLEQTIEGLEELKERELALLAERLDLGLTQEREAYLERLNIENKYYEEKQAIEDEQLAIQKEKEAARKEKEAEEKALKLEQEQIDFENQLALDEDRMRTNYELTKKYLDRDKEAELAQAEAVGADKSLIEAKYAKIDEDIRRTVGQAKLSIASNTLSGLVNLLGKESAVGKAAAIAQSIINVSQGVTKAIAQGGLAGLATGAIVAANGAVSIGKILSTPKPKLPNVGAVPRAERGMFLKGRRHSQGGIMIEAEDGEAVINRRSTAKYGPLLSAINQDGGGVPFMERGGVAGSTSFRSSNIIDYELLAAYVSQANASLPAQRVSVEEIQSVAGQRGAAEVVATF